MTRFPILPLALLAGCSALPTATTSPALILTEVQRVCAAALPLASAVPAVGVYATAFCSAANLAATVLTPADLAWISNILGELKGNVAPAVVQVAALPMGG
jgi:hypothetical protein